MQTYLEKRDAATNQARYYRMLVLPNLFGAWTLYREWGRIGQGGKVRMEWFDSEDLAVGGAARAGSCKTPTRVLGRAAAIGHV